MAMQISLTIHNRIVRDETIRWGGYEVKTTGDGFMIVFANCKPALQFCLSVLEALQNIEWPLAVQQHRSRRVPGSTQINGRAPGLTVGLGVHFGTPFMAELNTTTNRVDYYGPMINKSARMQGQAGDDTTAVTDDFIAQLAFEQSGRTVLATKLVDSVRTKILSAELVGREFEIRFKSDRVLKGIPGPEYVSLVHVPRCK